VGNDAAAVDEEIAHAAFDGDLDARCERARTLHLHEVPEARALELGVGKADADDGAASRNL